MVINNKRRITLLDVFRGINMNWKEWNDKRKSYTERCIDYIQAKLYLDDYQMMWLMWWDGFVVGILLWIIFS